MGGGVYMLKPPAAGIVYTPVGNSYLPILYLFKLIPRKLTDTDTDP